MYSTLETLIKRLDSSAMAEMNVIPRACPVPVFGDLSHARVATLGINPSDQEFFDKNGKELDGKSRRFPTLTSLGLQSWSEAEKRHLDEILDSCRNYFCRNPYDRWFKKLEMVVKGANASYYGVSPTACHLDLVPYATQPTWSKLRKTDRAQTDLLLATSRCTLGELLRESPVEILILNGKSVVKGFQVAAGPSLDCREMPDWLLCPKRPVKGFAFTGTANTLWGIELRQQIKVLGFNHNLQSSHGLTNQVYTAIREWVAQASQEALSTNRRTRVALGRAVGG